MAKNTKKCTTSTKCPDKSRKTETLEIRISSDLKERLKAASSNMSLFATQAIEAKLKADEIHAKRIEFYAEMKRIEREGEAFFLDENKKQGANDQ